MLSHSWAGGQSGCVPQRLGAAPWGGPTQLSMSHRASLRRSRAGGRGVLPQLGARGLPVPGQPSHPPPRGRGGCRWVARGRAGLPVWGGGRWGPKGCARVLCPRSVSWPVPEHRRWEMVGVGMGWAQSLCLEIPAFPTAETSSSNAKPLGLSLNVISSPFHCSEVNCEGQQPAGFSVTKKYILFIPI